MATTSHLMFDRLRLEVLFKNVASPVLRDMFTRRYTRSTGLKWEDGAGRSKEFLKKEGKRTKWMAIQKEKNLKADLRSMDLAHLAQLLRELKWTSSSTTPNITEDEKRTLEMENSLVKELKEVRNDHAHLGSSYSNKQHAERKFKKFWETAQRVLVELGGEGLLKEIDEILNTELKGLTYSDTALSEENMTKSRSLREEGKKFLGEQNLEKAIECYSEALELEGLSHVERGMLYSNRCHIYLLMIKDLCENESKKKLLLLALEDARFTTVEHRPSWWKGFYRAAQVYKHMNELKPALISCEHALSLILEKKETFMVTSLRDEIRKLAEDQGIKVDSSSDRPTEASVLQDVKRFAFQYGIELSDKKQLSKSLDELLNSWDSKAMGMGSVLKGHCYSYGLGGYTQDVQQGAKFYTKAVAKQISYGFYYSGLCHLNGQGVPKIATFAEELLKRATKFPETASLSMCALGKFHEGKYEIEKPQDFAEAAVWYSRASEEGNGEASSLLANLYSEGKGVEQSKSTAIRYWIKAAEQGYEAAMEQLASEYLEMGDPDEAESWFTRAIDAGCLSAFLNKNSFTEKLLSVRSESVQEI